MKSEKESHRDRIAREIAEAMEAGAAPWVKPWGSRAQGLPLNPITGTRYRGINLLTLAMMGEGANFATFKQITDAGGTVRKGARGLPIMFWSKVPGAAAKVTKGAEHDDDDDEGGGRRAPFVLRTYMVFSLETDSEGLESMLPPPPPVRPVTERHEQADRLISAWDRHLRGGIRHGGDRACYWPADDRIDLPPQGVFVDDPSYFATAFHEIGHATGAPDRLNRRKGKRFGDLAYALEELIAELTAAFLCAEIGIDGRLQHAEYLASWSKVLRNDPGAYLRACGQAQRAADRAVQEMEAGDVAAAAE